MCTNISTFVKLYFILWGVFHGKGLFYQTSLKDNGLNKVKSFFTADLQCLQYAKGHYMWERTARGIEC